MATPVQRFIPVPNPGSAALQGCWEIQWVLVTLGMQGRGAGEAGGGSAEKG